MTIVGLRLAICGVLLLGTAPDAGLLRAMVSEPVEVSTTDDSESSQEPSECELLTVRRLTLPRFMGPERRASVNLCNERCAVRSIGTSHSEHRLSNGLL